jgi:hypothetical protein
MNGSGASTLAVSIGLMIAATFADAVARGEHTPDQAGELEISGPVRVSGTLERTTASGGSLETVRIPFVFRTDGERWALSAGRNGFGRNGAREYAHDGSVYRELTFYNADDKFVDESGALTILVTGRVTRSSLPPDDHHYAHLMWFALRGAAMPLDETPADLGCLLLGVDQGTNPCRYGLRLTHGGALERARHWEISAQGWMQVVRGSGREYVRIQGSNPELHVDARIKAQFGRWGIGMAERVSLEFFDPVSRSVAPLTVTEVVVDTLVPDETGAPYVPTLPPTRVKVWDEVNSIEYVTLGAWLEPESEAYRLARRIHAPVDLGDNPASASPDGGRFRVLYVLGAVAFLGVLVIVWARSRR